MIDLSKVQHHHLACGYTDLCRGIDGLSAVITNQYGAELNEENIFLFYGRRIDRIKVLYFSSGS